MSPWLLLDNAPSSHPYITIPQNSWYTMISPLLSPLCHHISSSRTFELLISSISGARFRLEVDLSYHGWGGCVSQLQGGFPLAPFSYWRVISLHGYTVAIPINHKYTPKYS